MKIIYPILFGALAGTILFFILNVHKSTGVVNNEQIKVDSLIKYSNEKEARFNVKYDSILRIDSALKSKNISINKSIIKILKTNEQSKIIFFSATDSVKLFIVDSMLRANGYR